ncbi:MAG: putative toxin-antitoxin system toxin component, PIN family [Lautropia sp.]|nr:putative toxin-antitoxin system toxin component, PIN family [Lautropia sp.]
MSRLVIDTNIWLDLLVFHDPSIRTLREALEQGQHTVLCTPAMRAELAVVLARPQFHLDSSRQGIALSRYEILTQTLPPPPPCNLSCRDPDDRKFLDLAVAHRADWLLSKDRALLAARRFALRRFGLHIGTVTQMQQQSLSAPTPAGPAC